MCYFCVLSQEASRKCQRFSKLCPSVPRFPCGISCSMCPFYKRAFFKREIFGVVFSIKGKNRHPMCLGASLGCFTPGEEIPVHKILTAGRVLAFPWHHHSLVTSTSSPGATG